ncbi:hypothetical protein [Laceyella putida]|uniref:Uncharacterized protein n=1 Tax=Laceyella putida TaxID=110101 RepID=A0ABW2RJG0_9BACL
MAYYLKCGEKLLGTLYPNGNSDFPWIHCDFIPTEHFEEAKPLFDALWRLTEKEYDDDPEGWEKADDI